MSAETSRAGMSVLIVEDDESTAELEKRALQRAGRPSQVVGSVRAALDALRQGAYLAVFLDYRLPDGAPWPVLEAAQRAVPRIPVILVTAMGDEKIAAEVIHRGGADYVIKAPGFWDLLAGALERVLRLSEAEQTNARLAAIVESSDDAILSQTSDGTIVSWNPGAERLFGYTAEEAIGRPVDILVPPGWPSERPIAGNSSPRDAMRRLVETVRARKDGALVYVSTTEFPIFDNDGVAIGSGAVSRDIGERRRVEQSLRESEERFRLLAAATSDVVWDWNMLTDAIWWNEGVQKLFGYDPAEACADSEWWSRHVEPEDVDRVLAGIHRAIEGTGSSWADDYRFRRADGSVALVSDAGLIIRNASGRAVRMVGATVDTTERKELENQLRQAQKMEAIGQLAGGVAHDFNNLLTAILGYAELLAPQLSTNPVGLDQLGEIRKAGERAASLTRQLLAFSRRQVLEPKILDVNAVVRNVEAMLQRLIGEDVDLATSLDPALTPVLADAGQIEQVIMNLVVNSRDAMPRGGRITIETANVALDEEYAQRHQTVRAGAAVLLAVSDTGIGMDAATRARVFEPFFTTKGMEKGTGLGLSTVYGIVKQSGGHIWVYSEPGKGTTFKVYLPPVEGPLASTVPAPVAAPAHGSETILLVEDEDTVRNLTRALLEGLGYTVLEAGKAETAIEIARTHAGVIDLVLSDVVMPEIGGADLVLRLQAARPGIHVLYMSGYTDDAIVRHRVLEPGTSFLQKPFTQASLARKVRESLASKPGR